jgi:hypothetical protein
MLEGVLANRVQGARMQELPAHESRESGGEIRLGEVDDPSEHRLAELLADHRRGLEHALLAFGETIDARRQRGLNRGRDLELRQRLHRAVAAPLTDLLHEERVPERPLADPVRERREGGVVSEQLAKQLARLLRAELPQRERLAVRLPHPLGPVLGTRVDQQQRPGSAERRDDLLQKPVAPRIDPVEVVDEQDRGLPPTARPYEAPHGSAQHALARLAVDPGCGPFGVRNAQQVEHDREHLLELLVQKHEGARDLLAGIRRSVRFGDREETPQQLEQGQEGNGAAVRRAVRLVDGDAAHPASLDELETEPALPDARLPDHGDDPSVSAHGPRPGGLERRELAGATDEAREAASARKIEARTRLTRPGELVHADGIRGPFEPRRAQISKLEEAADESSRVLRQVDAVSRGDLLHARGQPDGVTVRRVVHAQVVADPPHDHLAGVETDADTEAEPALQAELVRVAPQLLAKLERRVAGALRVVFVCDRSPEQGHDPVSRVLVHGSLEAVHAAGENAQEAIEDAVPLLGIDLLRECQRALHIGEEHRHLLPLPLERGPGGQDLVGEVLRGVGARLGVRPDSAGRGVADDEPRSAGHAEPRRLRIRGPAARAAHLARRRLDPEHLARDRPLRHPPLMGANILVPPAMEDEP